ncbi:hypothetical protein [Xenorhabdus sp. SGI240]|uniref:hypothetical protein n=1 Tax=Xenorhabdus sp. SGI240 TaxID=3158262 RepID=UPI0032B81C71
MKILEALSDQQNACQKLQLKIEKLNLRQLQLSAFLAKRHARTPAWWTLRIKKICREKAIAERLSRRLEASQTSYQLEEKRFQKASTALNTEQQRYAPLKQKYTDVLFASLETDMEAPDIQRTAFGHDQALNEARSLLTVRALELH